VSIIAIGTWDLDLIGYPFQNPPILSCVGNHPVLKKDNILKTITLGEEIAQKRNHITLVFPTPSPFKKIPENP
jgi:hypothetical protein